MVENREFPDSWAEGVRSAIYKTGISTDPENYRGITVLSVFTNIFETAVHDQMTFANEAFGIIDKLNGGFIKGSRTADNLLILNTLIERQLILGKHLFICFVDFSKAFDRVNRHILFYKLIKSGFHGKVINTMRNMYTKTFFRLKCNGKLSPRILDELGVNQGGSTSDIFFRRYMADLGDYLTENIGICIEDMILIHLLWADDLLLVSDTLSGRNS